MKQKHAVHHASVSQIMHREPITILGNEPIRSAVEKMGVHGIRHLVVMSSAESVCGLISLRDAFRYLAENRQGSARVRDAMTAPIISADPEMSVSEAAQLMRKQRIGCLLIVSATHHLIGIVTRSDVLEFVSS